MLGERRVILSPGHIEPSKFLSLANERSFLLFQDVDALRVELATGLQLTESPPFSHGELSQLREFNISVQLLWNEISLDIRLRSPFAGLRTRGASLG